MNQLPPPSFVHAVAFHNTDAMFDQFQPSFRGTLGSGIYLGDHETAAAWHKALMVEAEITLKHAFVFDARYDDVYETPALDLICQVFSRQEQEALLQAFVKDDDCMFGTELQARLCTLGYDGIVAHYGPMAIEYVAFESSQVVIRTISHT